MIFLSSFPLLKKHSSKAVTFSAIFLLAFFFLRVLSSINQKSVTIDEFIHLPAGYYYLKTGDYKLFRIHPPFLQMVSALPMLFQDIHFSNNQFWKNTNDWSFGYDFMFTNGAQYQKIFTTSRLVILGFSILLGFFVFKWAKELFGPAAGLMALFLYSFNPDILAHSGLVTLDMGVSFFLFLTLYFFWKFFQSTKIVYGIFSGILLGLAFLSKYSALMAIPLILVISSGVILLRPKTFLRISHQKIGFLLILLFTLGLLVLNAGYGFKGSFRSLQAFQFQSNLLKPLNSPLVAQIPVPLPFDFFKGFDEQLDIQEGRFDSYLCGQVSDSTWWYYYLFAFFLKEPLSLLVLLLMASVPFLMRKEKRVEVILFVLLPQALFFIIISMASVNIGIRYLLPIFPFLFLFAGNGVNLNGYPKTIRKTLLVSFFIGCAAWYLLVSTKIHPHYISYFNEIAGGPENGYTYLIDSNIDWGQDLIELKKFLVNNEIDKISLAYFGRVDPELYGIQYDLLTNKKAKGYCAVSVSYLAGRPYFIYKDKKLYYSPPYFYAWLSEYQPIAIIGYSMHIYRID